MCFWATRTISLTMTCSVVHRTKPLLARLWEPVSNMFMPGTLAMRWKPGKEKGRAQDPAFAVGIVLGLLRCDQSHAFEFENDLVRTVIDLDIFGLYAEFRAFRYIVRI